MSIFTVLVSESGTGFDLWKDSFAAETVEAAEAYALAEYGKGLRAGQGTLGLRRGGPVVDRNAEPEPLSYYRASRPELGFVSECEL